MAKALTDEWNRRHDYLRISLIDKCNLRCHYCMPENIRFLPQSQLLSSNEIGQIARLFVEEYGIRRIRLTGGEPLLRPDFEAILADLASLPAKLALTTNAVLLDPHLPALAHAGLRSLNISLDSLRAERFAAISRRDNFATVWRNIERARAEGFRIKLNVVLMRGVNEDEIADFVALTRASDMHVRFIEFMPFDGNRWDSAQVFPYAEVLERVRASYPDIHKLKDLPHSTGKAWQVEGFEGSFAVISTVSAPFCTGCNRIRLTAEGKLRNCLFSREETDLRAPLRAGVDIRPLIEENIRRKAAALGGLPAFDSQGLTDSISPRAMVKIGG